MSNFLIALLALDIGVSLSKVYVFTWLTNYFSIVTYWIFSCISYIKKGNNPSILDLLFKMYKSNGIILKKIR